MSRFVVTMARELSQTGTVEVEASSAEGAERVALHAEDAAIKWDSATTHGSGPFCVSVAAVQEEAVA